MAATAAEDVQRRPVGGLEDHIGGVVGNLGGKSAHDAGQRLNTVVVADDDVRRVELAVHVVESRQSLAGLSVADVQATSDLGAIEGVHRLTE